MRQTVKRTDREKARSLTERTPNESKPEARCLSITEARNSKNRYEDVKNNASYRTFGLFGDPYLRPGIAGSAYDTAWLASVPADQERRNSRFPSSLQWLVEHQLQDGSWGGAVRYEHDRILSTLAALVPLATFGRRATDRACVEAGVRYLWQHCHLLPTEPMELVGFELLLPTLIRRAQRAGISVPPNLDIYGVQRTEKLRLIPPAFLYSSKATIVHSL